MTTINSTRTIPTPPAWVRSLDDEGNGSGPDFAFPSHTWDPQGGILLGWAPDDGPVVFIHEKAYTVAEARKLNARRLLLLAALAAAGVEDMREVTLPDWGTDHAVLTFYQALDVVTVTAQALEVISIGEVAA